MIEIDDFRSGLALVCSNLTACRHLLYVLYGVISHTLILLAISMLTLPPHLNFFLHFSEVVHPLTKDIGSCHKQQKEN